MKQRLALARRASQITLVEIPLDLDDMPPHCLPPFDLAAVLLGHASAHIVAAIPLEPASRVIWMNPALLVLD